MVINFSELEKQYIVIEKGKWTISKDCPQDIKLKLEKKISLLNKDYEKSKVNNGSQDNR